MAATVTMIVRVLWYWASAATSASPRRPASSVTTSPSNWSISVVVPRASVVETRVAPVMSPASASARTRSSSRRKSAVRPASLFHSALPCSVALPRTSWKVASNSWRASLPSAM